MFEGYMEFIWAEPDWPKLRWNQEMIVPSLAIVRYEQRRLIGKMESLGFHLREEAMLRTLTEDVVKTSEIEGEHLHSAQVRSSFARRLGIDIGALTPADRHVEGIVEIMLDAVQKNASPITEERILSWHGALFPTGRSGLTKISVGE
jgi:Fic family protein